MAKLATQVTTSGFRANWGAVAVRRGTGWMFRHPITFSSFVGPFDNLAVAGYVPGGGIVGAGTVYFYRVRAENAGGASGNSAIITVTTVTLPPVATPATGVSTRASQLPGIPRRVPQGTG